MSKVNVKPTSAVIADNRVPKVSIGGKPKTSSTTSLGRPTFNEFAGLQQRGQSASKSSRPSLPNVRPGAISSVLFSRTEPVQPMIKPDRAMVLAPTPAPTKLKLVSGPTATEMREALTVLQGVFGPKPGVVRQKKSLGMKEEMSLEDAQQIVVAGAKEHLGLAIWDLKYGLTEEQVKLGLEKLDPNRTPELKPTTEQIKEAGKPKSSAKAKSGIAGAAGIPAPSGDGAKFIAFIDNILEPPSQPPSELEQFERVLRQTRMQPFQDQFIFQDNELGPLNTIYRAFRGGPMGFEGMPGQGGLGSQAWQAVRGFGGFGGGSASAAAAGTAGAGATAGGATVGGATAGAGAAGAVTIGGVTISAGAVVAIAVVVVLFIVGLFAVFQLKQQDMAEIIPVQGTGGLDGGGGGSFGPSYIFDGVCWPIAGPGVQVSDTPEGHADRDLSDGGSAIDIRAIEGTPVQSSVDGIIIYSGRHGAARPSGWAPYGGLVVIKIDPAQVKNERVLVFYAHLSEVAIEVPLEGDEATRPQVRAGDYIGDVGNTGNSHGSHLHMESINMDIRSILPTWQEIEINSPIPDRCEGGSEIIL